jgi:hypothetical protein
MKNHSPGLMLISLLITSFACQTGSDSLPPTEGVTASDSSLPAEIVTATITASAIPAHTATLEKPATAEIVLPTETASVPEFIALDLQVAGYTIDQGELLWEQSEELALFNDAVYPDNVLYQALEPGLTAANFVFSTELEWDSEVFNGSYNYSACGVIFRAKDIDHGEQAHFNAVLVNPTAYPAWEIELWNSGQSQSSISGLRLGSGMLGAPSTNHFLIIADGSMVTVFANGARLDSVTLPASLREGEFAILSRAGIFTDPGITSCIFTNTWIWELP